MDFTFKHSSCTRKPRNYREKARKDYLRTAQKKRKSAKEIRKAIGKQLSYIKRDLSIIEHLLDHCSPIPFDAHQYKYWLVIQHTYAQQLQMYQTHTQIIEDRIVSIHQPHVRPIVRGKSTAKIEFGAKINVSLVNGLTFLDDLDWNAFNEGVRLPASIANFKERTGHYPEFVFADKIYCTRDNRRLLKELGIILKAKPLGRPAIQAAQNPRVSPGERNPIEGKFGQAKRAYGMNRIMARLARTSESWIASIILVLNLAGLAQQAALLWIKWFISKYCLVFRSSQQHVLCC